MFLRITDDLRWSVEAHGLRIQQRAGKDGRMMTFDPGGNIDQLGEGLRMAFGETVAAEPFNLLETAFGKIAFITALHHAADHLVLIFVDRPHIADSRHCPTQTIGLIRREFRSEEHTSAIQSLMRISYDV